MRVGNTQDLFFRVGIIALHAALVFPSKERRRKKMTLATQTTHAKKAADSVLFLLLASHLSRFPSLDTFAEEKRGERIGGSNDTKRHPGSLDILSIMNKLQVPCSALTAGEK